MNENDVKVKEKNTSSPYVKWGIFAGIVLIAFLIGLIPMLMQKWEIQSELAKTQTQLRQSEIKGLLTSAIVEAKRGEYEPARQSASSYFTQLRTEEEKSVEESFLTTDVRGKLKPIFDERDAIITMLAQRDPASVERLTNVYATYLQAMGIPQPAKTVVPPANTAETPAANTAQ